MVQIHKRFTDEQVKELIEKYLNPTSAFFPEKGAFAPVRKSIPLMITISYVCCFPETLSVVPKSDGRLKYILTSCLPGDR